MQYIAFECSTLETNNRAWKLRINGLHLCGDANLTKLSRGDILWIATRLSDSRATPALCGRLTVEAVRQHIPGAELFVEQNWDCSWQLIVRPQDSVRCTPFPAEIILSWNIWRKQFSGMVDLDGPQSDALQTLWNEQATPPLPPILDSPHN